MSKTRKPLKRVSLVMGMDAKGNPMAWSFTSNEFRRIYLQDDAIFVESTKHGSDEKINTLYPLDKFMAIEYVIQDLAIVLDLKAIDVS